MPSEKELPRYRCHKIVWALKIEQIDIENTPPDGIAPGAMITPEEKEYCPFRVDASYLQKHSPKPGGYYVVYEDGYQSYSPPHAFEAGYTKL